MKKLYNVRIENEVIIAADSKEEAEKIARRECITLNDEGWEFRADDLYHTAGWSKGSIPYGAKDNQFVESFPCWDRMVENTRKILKNLKMTHDHLKDL